MTTDKSSGKTAQLRTMTIKAWRERWTASQYATQVKSVLGRGVSGDVYSLSDCLLQQALTGPAPNQLLLSLLDHCLASQLVSYSATLHSISKFSSFSRPHCTAALLTLLLSHTPFINCRSPRPEECLVLATGLVSVSTWALSTTTQTVARLVELRDSHVDMTNLSRVQQLLTWLATDIHARCLSYTGRLEDTELHQELITTAKKAMKECDKIYMFAAENSDTAEQLRRVIDIVRNLEPCTTSLNRGVSSSGSHLELSYSLHSILSYDAVLCPTSDLTQLAGHLSTILQIKNVSISNLVCHLVRCCLTSMNEHDGFEVLKWDAFTLIKLPKLISLIVGANGQGEVYQGLKMVLDSSSLLDMTDARCKGANAFELIITSMKNLLTESESDELISIRQTQLEARKMMDLKPPADSRDVTLIIKADTTLGTIIQTFENRSTEQSEFENLLSVMFHIIKGSSFDLLLSASAANGSLNRLIRKLLIFNEGCKESPGESVRVSQSRAALFDMTFLMLTHIIQCFGSDVVLDTQVNCFFSQWARKCMTEPGHVKPLSGWTASELAHVGDSLLQQLTSGEVRTQVVLWNNICNSVHLVMREMMTGMEAGMVSMEMFDTMCRGMYSKLCCLPVCVLSWLTSYSHFGQSPVSATSPSPLEVLDKFVDITIDTENETDGLPYFQQRSTMMVNIVRKMRQELEAGEVRPQPGQEAGGWSWYGRNNNKTSRDTRDMGLEEELGLVWEDMWARGRLDIAGTKQIARLFRLGGAEWFVTVLVERMVGMVYHEDVDKATELVFSLLHVDLVQCTLALLVHVLPRCLVAADTSATVHPGGKCLAKLTVDCLAASLSMRSSRSYVSGQANRSAEMADMCNGPQQPVKLRKLTSSEAVVTSCPEQEQLVDQAHTGLFTMLAGVGMEPVITPRLEFVCHVLEQAAMLGSPGIIRQVLAPAPVHLIMQVVRVRPDRFSQELVIKMFDTNTSSGRRNMAKILCLMRNVQATTKSDSIET